MVDCKVEINGQLFDWEFWFKAEDMAYDFKHTVDASMEAIEVEFDFQKGVSITMGLRCELVMTVKVDSSAHFLEVDGQNNLEVIKEKITDALYDLEELKVEDVDIMRRLD